MKSTTLLLLGGLAFAGAALAAEPTPQSTSTGSSMKVGIDAKTGERRVLTPEESAALDAQGAKLRAANAGAASRGIMTKRNALVAPATYAESAAAPVSRNGLTGYLAPLESMSGITATVGADGKVTILEDGHPMTNSVEMASE